MSAVVNRKDKFDIEVKRVTQKDSLLLVDLCLFLIWSWWALIRLSVSQSSSDVVSVLISNWVQNMARQGIQGVFPICLGCWGPLAAKFCLCLERLPEFMKNSWRSVEVLEFRVSWWRVQDFGLEYGSVRYRQIDGESQALECSSGLASSLSGTVVNQVSHSFFLRTTKSAVLLSGSVCRG